MRYHLDKNGGFTVIDDNARVARYAYPASYYATRAARSAAMAESTAYQMILTARDERDFVPAVLIEETYKRLAAALDTAKVKV